MPKRKRGTVASTSPENLANNIIQKDINATTYIPVIQNQDLGVVFYTDEQQTFYYTLKEKRQEVIPQIIAPAVRISHRLYNPITQETSYEVVYKDQTFILPTVSDMDTIEKITGLPILQKKDFLTILALQAEKSKQKYLLNSTGWFQGKYRTPIVTDEEIIFQNDIPAIELIQKDPDKQLLLIKNALEEGKLLGMLFLISASAMLPDSYPFACFITGQRGIGKTTVSQLAVNIYGVPANAGVQQMFATSVGLELTLATCKDSAVLLDEAINYLEDQKIEQILFMITGGQTKRRGTKQVTTAPVTRIKVGLFSTSERLMDFTRGGSSRRMYAFSIADRDEITNLFKSKYDINEAIQWGGCIVELADFYMKHHDKFTREKAQKLADKLGAPETFAPAIDLLRAYMLFAEYYGCKFPKMEQYLESFFAEISQELQKDFVAIFSEVFPEWVIQNQKHFRIETGKNVFSDNTANPVYGILQRTEQENTYYAVLLSTAFSQFCKEVEPQLERQALLRQLQAKHLLKSNSEYYFRFKGDTARYIYPLLPITLGFSVEPSEVERIVALAHLTGEADDYSDEEELSEADILPF